MKKILTVLLAMVMVISLAACGGSNPGETRKDTVDDGKETTSQGQLNISVPDGSTVGAEEPSSSGENIVFFGDSLVYGFSVDPSERYATLLSAALGMKEYNFAVSGAGFAAGLRGEYQDPENRIIYQVQDCDMSEEEIAGTSVVIVAAGWNDIACGLVTDYSWLESCVDEVLTAVKEKFPESTVFFVYGENSYRITEFEDTYAAWTASMEEHVSTAFSDVKVVEGYGDCINRDVQYYNDTIHPNAAGHSIIAQWLGTCIYEMGW